jgi:hypothetical protein
LGVRLLDKSGGTPDKSGEALWSPIRLDLFGPPDKSVEGSGGRSRDWTSLVHRTSLVIGSRIQ